MGFLLALIIGLTLGLIGGGGSILTVPVLVYVMDVTPVQATAYSLFVVGLSALVGAFNFHQKQQVDFKMGLLFASPAFIGVYLSRKYLLPALPDTLYSAGDWLLTKDLALMLFFAFIMLLAALSMIFVKRKDSEGEDKEISIVKVILEGLILGVVTGVVGAGGGFLIIPALVLLAGMPMKKAVGTSLMIIAVKSLVGFLGEWGNPIDWELLLPFSAMAVAGILIGTYLSKYIDGKKLKQSFGLFVLLMAVFIILKETIL